MPPAENRWTKKRKAEEEAAVVPAANVVVQFQSDAGEKTGEQRHEVLPAVLTLSKIIISLVTLQDHSSVSLKTPQSNNSTCC